MTIADIFAQFLAGAAGLDGRTTDHARTAIFDLVIATMGGHDTEGAQAARMAARASWGQGPVPIWFTSDRLTVPGAAFANSAAASMLDLDDGHRAAAGHPGASIIPAVLATAAKCEIEDDRILTAIALGYEVAIRIAASRDYAALTTMVSGPWVGQGAAAAAAWLRGLSREATAQAITLAGASAPNLAAISYSRVMGNHLKEGIPWATATGLAAVDLAAAGFTGPSDLLDNDALFHPAKLVDGLGHTWAIEGIYFKPYGCCRWAHAAIDGILDLRETMGSATLARSRIEVQTFGWATRLNNETSPRTLESAQYSVPFCVALAAIHGGEPLVRLQPEALFDQEVQTLARKVDLVIDPQFDRMFPAGVPARVIVHSPDGRLERTVMAPLGEPTKPLDWAALERKFAIVARGVSSTVPLEVLLDGVRRLRQGQFKPLLNALYIPANQKASGRPAGSRHSRRQAGIINVAHDTCGSHGHDDRKE